MFSAFDAAAVTALLAQLVSGLTEYIPFLLLGAGVTIPIVFARKGVQKLGRWIRLRH